MKTTYRIDVTTERVDDPEVSLGRLIRVAYAGLNAAALRQSGIALDAEDRLGSSFAVARGGLRGPRLTAHHDRRKDGIRLEGLRYDGPPDSRGVPELRLDVLVQASGDDPGGTVRLVVEQARPDAFGWDVEPPPAFVPKLLAALGFEPAGEALTGEAPVLGRDEVERRLIPLLQDPDRSLPVVVCSPTALTQRPLMDADEIQEAVVGHAVVRVLANRSATFPLPDALGPPFACYDGAIRIYYPGLRPDSTPGDHPLWKPDEQMEEEDFPVAVLEKLLQRARDRVAPGNRLDWETLEATALRKKLGSLDDQALVAQLRERESALVTRITELEGELEEERDRVASLRAEIGILRDRLERTGHDPSGNGAGEEADEPPARTPESIVRGAVARHPDRLVLALNNRSDLSGSLFEDLDALESVMDFLATTYWEARFRDRRLPDPDQALRRVASGFFYRSHQGSSTVGRYSDYYRSSWNGTEYELGIHVGKGTSRDPRHSVRIGLAVDAEREVIVIGYFGQHQKTTSS